MKKRMISVLLAVLMLLSALPIQALAAEAPKYGDVPIWTNSIEVCYMAEQILKEIPTAGKSKVEQIRAVYDWIIYHCSRYEYEWDGTYYFDENQLQSQITQEYLDEANAAARNGRLLVREDFCYEYPSVTEPSMVPYDSNYYIDTFAYSMMMTRNGNCAHYASLLVILLGHLGFDCRLIDGEFINGNGSRVEHKWNYVLIDGKYYWLDPRMDHANYKRLGYINYEYFLVESTSTWARTHAWDHTYSDWLAANAANITQYYNDTLDYAVNPPGCNITVLASRSGTATGGGFCQLDSSTTLTASPAERFDGWYNTKGELLSASPEYTFTPTEDMTVYAMFQGDRFVDVENAWYTDAVMECAERGYVNGKAPFCFDPNANITRAEVAQILYNLAGEPPVSSEARFSDVPANAWYTSPVNWAADQGITSGIGNGKFDPTGLVTREQFARFLYNYAVKFGGVGTSADGDLSRFPDHSSASDWATESLSWAVGHGIVSGTDTGLLIPKDYANRAQVVSMLMRFVMQMQ